MAWLIFTARKKTLKAAEIFGVAYELNSHGEVILNEDNDENRRMVERCYRTRKTIINPIVDWTDEDVWEFLNGDWIRPGGVPHCCLYDQGFKRLGCIGCPMAGTKRMAAEFLRWPKYRDHYLRAFQRMIDLHPDKERNLQDVEPAASCRAIVEEVMRGADEVSCVGPEAVKLFRNWLSFGAN